MSIYTNAEINNSIELGNTIPPATHHNNTNNVKIITQTTVTMKNKVAR